MKKLFILVFLFFCVNAYSATEDLTTYTYDTPSGYCAGKESVTADNSDVNSINRSCNNVRYYDFGSGYFGNFDIDQTITIGSGLSRFSFAYGVGVSNISHATYNEMATGTNGIQVQCHEGNAESDDFITLLQHHDSDSDAYGISESTTYYISLIRTASTVNLYIYSDSGRTTLLDTLSVTHNGTTYQYLNNWSSRETSGSEAYTFDVGYLEIIDNGSTPTPDSSPIELKNIDLKGLLQITKN